MTDMKARPGECAVPGDGVAVMAERRWEARICIVRGGYGDQPCTPATPEELRYINRIWPHVARMAAAADAAKGE